MEPAFYCLVYGGMPVDPALGERGVAEVTVRDVPMKPPALATLKSNNYLLNCLTAMRARDQGGHFGVLVDENGMVTPPSPHTALTQLSHSSHTALAQPSHIHIRYDSPDAAHTPTQSDRRGRTEGAAAQLAESCVLNVALVTADGSLCTPRFDNILAGLTVQRILELAQVRRWQRHSLPSTAYVWKLYHGGLALALIERCGVKGRASIWDGLEAYLRPQSLRHSFSVHLGDKNSPAPTPLPKRVSIRPPQSSFTTSQL